MKITIDKERTTLAQVDKMKEAVKVFRDSWTEKDLFAVFCHASHEIEMMALGSRYDAVLSCSVNVFPAGWNDDCDVWFGVSMDVKGWSRFAEIHFYIDNNGNIDTRDFDLVARFNPQGKMYSVIEYERVTEPLK